MAILFTDENGNILRIVKGEIVPDQYQDNNFPPKWKWKEITDEETDALTTGFKESICELPRHPHERINNLEKHNEKLVEVLEETLKLKKGHIKDKLKQKMEE